MSPKVVFSTLLCLAASIACAQSVNFSFPDDGDRQVWVGQGLPTEPPTDKDGVRTLKSDATLPAGDQKPTASVFVWDRKSGNLALKPLKDASSLWTVKATDYQDIAQVSVHVEHSGKPVAAATVELDDGRRRTQQLLSPSNNGTVTFFGVKPGSLKITVRYKVAGKDAKPVTQLLDAPLTRSEPVPTATIALADAVDVVGPAAVNANPPTNASPPSDAAGPSTGAGKAPAKGGDKQSGGIGGFLGSLLVYVIALGAMGAVIYYAMQYMKKNSDSVASKLEQLGVQIPKPGDDPLTNPTNIPMPMPKTPAPVQKIILDDAVPDLIAPVAASTVIADPRLVSQSGDSLSLPEGDLVVGREVGLGLSLVGESTVSRTHAVLKRSGNMIVVQDMGSTNGTFVNGVQLQGEKQLQAGDTVQFGSVRFRFEG